MLRVLAAAPLLYLAVVAFVRVSGKRSTSKMNTFDWIVTVALGSMLSTGALSSSVAPATALAGIGALLVLQWAFTKGSAYSPAFHRLINASPTLLYVQGEYLEGPMRRERVARSEIVTAARENGHATMDTVGAVVLEPDGDLSVLGTADTDVYATLDGVEAVPESVRTTA